MNLKDIYQKLSLIEDGTRVLMPTHRKKDGGNLNKPDRHMSRVIVKNKKQLLDIFTVMKENLIDGGRIYTHVNPRDIGKAIRKFKSYQLDNDYSPNPEEFYYDIENRFISALSKRSSKLKTRFLIDFDGDIDKYLEEINILKEQDLFIGSYKTKNGTHVISKAYNYPKLTPRLKDHIKPDAQMLLYWK